MNAFLQIFNALFLGIAEFLKASYGQGLSPSAKELAMRIIVFCRIHFNRGVNRVLQKASGCPANIGDIMRDLINQNTREDYERVLTWVQSKLY